MSTNQNVAPGVVWDERSCAGVDPDLFFINHFEVVQAAQRVCAACPVLAGCARLALRQQPIGCVVASVWVPGIESGWEAREAARRQLRKVAATGAPAPSASSTPAPRTASTGPLSWRDPGLQAAVRALRGQGWSWSRIAIRTGCSRETVRRAYAAGVVSS
ncbi:WhiB family transcriptional regulator [Nocardia otitidiscaviarum]|uniref:WhiB family transcriptional regulator n=1 Tax=Nocardia otitidiscaviarum TaxID=1823 RepID=UPI0024562423|nr:WhiB family transcriptional regulator [Nocardia otitidiscaviarum]